MEVNERIERLEGAVAALCDNDKLLVENHKTLHTAITVNVADAVMKMDADVTRLGELYEKLVVVVNAQAELLKQCAVALEAHGLLGSPKQKEMPN